MKTVYTDRLGFYPWAMSFVSVVGFWYAYDGFTKGDGTQFGLGIGSGSVFLILALKRFLDIREAKRKGRDATILRISENGR